MLLGGQELRDRDVRLRESFIEIARGSAGEGILLSINLPRATLVASPPLYMLYVPSLSLTNLKHIE